SKWAAEMRLMFQSIVLLRRFGKGVMAQMSLSYTEPSIRKLAIAVLLFKLTMAVSMAQTGSTGAIAGVITDPAGSVVPQAEIKVTNADTGETRTTATQTNGTYLVALLPPGLYRVEVSK